MGGDEPERRENVTAGEIYGTVVYLTVLVLLEEDRSTPEDAIGILLGTAVVFWLAHIYAFLVPRIATEGRVRRRRLRETARDQIGIPLAVAIPVAPLALAAIGVLPDATGFRGAIVLGVMALGAFSLREARSAGIPWGRSVGIALILLVAGLGLLALEVSLH